IRVERVEEASVGADRLVADSGLSEARRRRDGLRELEVAVIADAVARDRPVAEVRHEGEAAVLRHGGPANLAAHVSDGAADRFQLPGAGQRVRRGRRLPDLAPEGLGDVVPPEAAAASRRIRFASTANSET